MGFLNAVRSIGEISKVSGIEAYLKFPLTESKPKKGDSGEYANRIIRIWLDIKDVKAEQLDIRGVKKIDLIDYLTRPEMKRKYLYKEEAGKNVFWRFTPLHKMGKPPKDLDARKKAFVGKGGDWRNSKDCTLFKLQYRVLTDYENEEKFSEGSVDRIMSDLESSVDGLAHLFEGKGSFIILFGADNKGEFIYPGEIPAFVRYFESKLEEHVTKKSKEGKDKAKKTYCFCCEKETNEPATLDMVFKFSTFDKVNYLPGLDKNNILKVQPICQKCFQHLTVGRERIERELADKETIPGITIWLTPEVVAFHGDNKLLERSLDKLTSPENVAAGIGQEAERKFFHRLSRQDAGLVFHFLFWEKQNAQERVHLMVEDVPPSRLAMLEKAWRQALTGLSVERDQSLDTAIKTIYSTFIVLSGKSQEDKEVMRDFIIRIIGKMLKGETLPAETLKTFFVSRIPKLVFDTDRWFDVKRATLNAQLVVEFFEHINREARLNETGSFVS